MSKIGIRCLRCNTDVWVNPIQTTYCPCRSVNIGIEDFEYVIGNKKGAPYSLLREENGKITVADPINTERAPAPTIDISHRKRPIDNLED